MEGNFFTSYHSWWIISYLTQKLLDDMRLFFSSLIQRLLI
jgi:hypothetical protein